LVGLSLDGPGGFHNANRKDPQGQGTFRRVLAAKERMDRAGVEYNILAVLTGQLARHPRQVWNFLLEQNIRFVQFIPCLGPLEGGASPAALTPERYADFYTALFDLWAQACQQGTYLSVKLFDDLIQLLAFGQCNACGLLGRCQAQLIVEADGSVYPCDFYALDDWKAGNLGQQSLRAVYESPVMARFVNREVPLPYHCRDCPYAALCGGGCPRMRREVFGLGGRVCGHRLFLDRRGPQLQQLALLARRAARP
jgi:uncharacterized protein